MSRSPIPASSVPTTSQNVQARLLLVPSHRWKKWGRILSGCKNRMDVQHMTAKDMNHFPLSEQGNWSRKQLSTYCLRIIVVVMKDHDQSNLGRKELIWHTLPHHWSSLKEVRTGTLRPELTQGPWRCAVTADWLALPTKPRVIPPTLGWALPHQSLRKCPIGLPAYITIFWRHFLY